jgi:hypothetical protein
MARPTQMDVGEYTDDDDDDLGTNFARQLELVTKSYSEMIELINSLMREVTERDPEIARQIRDHHQYIPDSLRAQLEEDTDGSRAMMHDYLQTMRTGIVHAAEIENYVPPMDCSDDQEDYLVTQMSHTDMTVGDVAATSTKPQGCDTLVLSHTTRTEMGLVSEESNGVTSRLGADPE